MRHIPVFLVSAADDPERSLRMGAWATSRSRRTATQLGSVFAQLREVVEKGVKRLLVVEPRPRWAAAGPGADRKHRRGRQDGGRPRRCPAAAVRREIRLPRAGAARRAGRPRAARPDRAQPRAAPDPRRAVHRRALLARGRGGGAAAGPHAGAEGGALRRAAARRDRSFPAPRRVAPAGGQAGPAAAPAHLARSARRPDRADRRRRRAQHLRDDEPAREARNAGDQRRERQGGAREAARARPGSTWC